MALWVISSTKYIQAARCLRRSLRLGGRKTSLLASVFSHRSDSPATC